MDLTIALSISSSSTSSEILNTLDTIPVDTEGVDLIIYSENTKKIKQIIKEGELEENLKRGEVNVLFCESPYSSNEVYHGFGLEDSKTDLITFLNSGDLILDFQDDMLIDSKYPLYFPGLGQDGLPESLLCYDSRMLPVSYRGIIFNVNYLRKHKLIPSISLISSFLSNLTILKKDNYWDGWGNFDASESWSVELKKEDLESEMIVPETLIKLWKSEKIPYNNYLRDLIWSRISTSAARIVTSYPDKKIISKYQIYLFPENKTRILN